MISRVVAMREAGRPNGEIAASIKVSPSRLDAQIGKLVREGAISSRKGLLRSQPDSFVEGRERTRQDVAGNARRLYQRGRSHKQIAVRLALTPAQVHGILTELFASGLSTRGHRLTDAQARAIHVKYLSGGSIDRLAGEIGFSGTAVRTRMHNLGLPIDRGRSR